MRRPINRKSYTMFKFGLGRKAIAIPAATGALAAGKAVPKAKAKASPKAAKAALVSGTVIPDSKMFDLRKAAVAAHVSNADTSKTAAQRTWDYFKEMEAQFGSGFTKISKAKNAVLNDNEKAILPAIRTQYIATVEATKLAWNENSQYAIWSMIKAFDTGKLGNPYEAATKAKRETANPKLYDAKEAWIKANKPIYRALMKKLEAKAKPSALDLALGLELGNRLKAFGVDLSTLNAPKS
jgi:hypothetical protein